MLSNVYSNWSSFLKCPCISVFLCSVNGFGGSPGGGSLGKIMPPKSPPLPPVGNNLLPSSRKTDLRVVIPQSKGMTMVSVWVEIGPQLNSLKRLGGIGLICYIESFHDKKSHKKVCRKFHEKIKSHVEKNVKKVIKSHENRLNILYRVISWQKKS